VERQVALFLALFLFGMSTLAAQSKIGPSATIEDTQGVTTNVTNLSIESAREGPRMIWDGEAPFGEIIVNAGAYYIAVPVNSLLSFTQASDSITIVYFLNGKQISLQGRIFGNHKAHAESDFGRIELTLERIRKINVTTPPMPPKFIPLSHQDATVSLSDGSVISVTDFIRVSHEYTDLSIYGGFGKLWNANANYDIAFLRGDSTARIKFSDISKLTIDKNRIITVYLTKGTSYSGKIPPSDIDGIDGFSCYFEKGYCYIPPNNVVSVVLNTAP
jgi:hypothetical protein